METARPNIIRGTKISGIWAIPILALVLGAYMVLHSWLTEGPEIEIAFKNASGIEPGQTKIKYRNVDIGVVEKVRLNDQFDGVIARAKLDRQALPLLRSDTRFWVVTARVGLSDISGLDTLITGAYIQLGPGTGEEGQTEFIALEQPPLTPMGAPGLRLQLTSERASSVSAGDTVLYKGYAVGRVESMKFDPKKREVRYVVFIDAPYHRLVTSSARFWDVSGITVHAGAEGIKVEAGSVDTVLLGGVAFEIPAGMAKGDVVEHNSEFKLYNSYADIVQNPYRFGAHYVVSFEQSVKGLLPGAAVEYRGIPIGRVERVLLKESLSGSINQSPESPSAPSDQVSPIHVLIYLEPARLELPDQRVSLEQMHQYLESGVRNGLRASLENDNLLTGSKYIGLDFFTNVEAQETRMFNTYSTIPSIDTGLGQLQQKFITILDTVNELPLDKTVGSANSALDSLNDSLSSLQSILTSQDTKNLPLQLEQTLRELQQTLSGYSPDSETYDSINSSLELLNRTLSNFEALSDTLARQPNSFILPVKQAPDPMPEVKQ